MTTNSPTRLSPSNKQASESSKSKKISWQQIETSDYPEYVRNLREIGCPEPTVEDIIVADVNAFFLEKSQPVLESFKKTIGLSFTDNVRGKLKKNEIVAETKKSLDVLNEERLSLINKLLGHPVEKFKIASMPWSYALQEIADTDMPFLTEEKRRKLKSLEDAMNQKLRSIFPTGKSLNEEQVRVFDKMTREREIEVAKLLDPKEFEIYLLNRSDAAAELRYRTSQIELTDDEYKGLFKLKKDYEDKYGGVAVRKGLSPEDPMAAAQKPMDEMKLARETRSLLGDERYLAYLSADNSTIKTLASFGEQNQLDSTQVLNLSGIRDSSERAVISVMGSQLSLEDRKAKVMEILKSTESELKQSLGEAKAKLYLEGPSGKWISNLGSAEIPTVWSSSRAIVILPEK